MQDSYIQDKMESGVKSGSTWIGDSIRTVFKHTDIGKVLKAVVVKLWEDRMKCAWAFLQWQNVLKIELDTVFLFQAHRNDDSAANNCCLLDPGIYIENNMGKMKSSNNL